MTYPPSFKEDYVRAATALDHFISWAEMHQYHPTGWRMKLDKALGMPWTLYRITPGVAIRFSFTGAALNMKPQGLRFAPATPPQTGYDAQMFDNLARHKAPDIFHGFKGISWHIHDLRGYLRGDRPIRHDPDRVPAMAVDIDLNAPDPTPEEREQQKEEHKRKWEAHVAAHKAKMAGRLKEETAFAAHVSRHDPATTTGAQAFYTDIRLHLTEGLNHPDIPDDFRAYYEWLARYVDLKAAGKADKDILPLRLDHGFPELGPKPRRSGPAP